MTDWHKDIIDPGGVRTLDGLFCERVRRTPDTCAYMSFEKDANAWSGVTWSEVAREVVRWQAALRREGLEAGDRVGIALRNSREWVCLDQAALGLGLVVVPFYTDDRPDNVAYILKDAGVKLLLLGDPGAWRRLAPFVTEHPELKRILLLGRGRGPTEELSADARASPVSEWLSTEAGELPERQGDPDSLASIVYTSGTTGRPKGVMLSHGNMLSIAHAAVSIVGIYRDDLFLSFLPLSHTLERTGGYYLPMMAGATVAYARSIPQLAEDLQTVRPTLLIAVPRIFERVYGRLHQQLHKQSRLARWMFETAVAIGWRRFEHQQGRAAWHPKLLAWPLMDRLVAAKIAEKLGGRLRIAVSGGAALGTPVARLFIGLGLTLLQGYGMTETSPVISVNHSDENDPASVGPPLPGVEVRIGEDQELLVKSPGAMLGYWNNPEATAAVIDEQGWLHTGDQARIDEKGRIHITGRIKDILVLSNGEKVPPGDMEGTITLDELFDQAMVIGEGHPFLSAILVLSPEAWPAFAREHGVDPDDTASFEDPRVSSAVLERVSAKLKSFPGYAKIRRVILELEPWSVENGLLTPTLKVKRNRVMDHYAARAERIYAEGPAGPARRRVA
jgi:long-chain acyl-CoA synthetase